MSENSLDENSSSLPRSLDELSSGSSNSKEHSQEFYNDSDLNYRLKEIVFESTPSTTEEDNNCCCCRKKKKDSEELSDSSSDTGSCICVAYIVAGLNFTYKFILALSVTIVLLNIIISFYTVIIINYVFFISTVVSYILSPLYHGLSEDWIQYAFSVLQVILANPLIEFFIYFVIKTVKNFIDSISEFATLIKFAFVSAINSGYSKLGSVRLYPYIADRNLIRQLGLVLASLLALAAAGGITYVTFVIDKLMILLGMIPYIAIVAQIICLMFPAYAYYGRIFRGVHSNKPVCMEELIKKCAKTYSEFIEENDENRAKQTTTEIQTFESVFNEARYEALELSSESAFLSGADNDNNEEDQKRDEGKDALFRRIVSNVSPLVAAVEYVPLFDYTLQIGHDKFTRKRKRFILILFTLLNLAAVAFDIYRLIGTWNVYFLVSIILRILFFPLFAYFNVGTAFMYKAKSAMLHFVVILATAITFIVFIASICVLFYSKFISDMTRINNLEYVPNSTLPYKAVYNDACFYNYGGLSLIDAYGLSLGPFDVERNYTIFDNQMKYFFGSNWSDTIKYEVHHIDKDTPFIIYTINESLVVYGFRGFSSGTELCLQIEMLAIQYALPFFQDIVPFYRIFIDNFIGFYSRFAHNFGNHFFDPVAISYLFVDPIEEIYASKDYSENTTVLFTGINIGGMFAKVLGMIHKKQGIGFATLPAFNDYFLNSFDFEDEDSIYITNVYNYNGWFTMQEPDVATNIGIPWVSGANFIERDSVYRTFCTITEMCGYSPQFYNYCTTVVEDMDEISEYFNEVAKPACLNREL